jgi:hypothetical protein
LADWFYQEVVLEERFSIEDQKVLTVAEWCELNGLSEPTGKRLLASGDGPSVIQLSKRRVGIRLGDNRRWQESRVRGKK